jgi:glycosyltransferase involved in cell wall biosynthesis
MTILHLMSCSGWSSDAYWAARVVRELAARGHDVTLGCRAGTEARVIDRARAEGVTQVTTFAFAGGVRPAADAADVRALGAWLGRADVVHVHRGKEHWLAAVANRISRTPRPLVRTRHIVQPVRVHAANRWLYRHATALVITVSEVIRRQYVESGLVPGERVVALPGGADVETYRPLPRDPEVVRRLGGVDGVPLVGMFGGLRAMKGHAVVLEAVARLLARGVRARFVVVGRGRMESAVRAAVAAAGLQAHVTVAGFVDDLAQAMAGLDVALYVPLQSEGMSRIVFEYLAAGCPLVAARVGVVPEILTDAEHARLVPAGDAAAVAAAIEALLRDPTKARRIADAGRRLVLERYSGARVAAAVESLYRRLVPAGAGVAVPA